MKILILSWRDIRSPLSGGAEIFTYENAKRWVAAGHEVTWFSSDFGDCPKEETIDDIRIIRRGTEVTIIYHAFRHYKKSFKGKCDLIIDQINTIPFLTPLYVKEKKVLMIFQLARKIWFFETFFPLSLIGFIMEYLYLKIYKKTPVLTISESTKQDLTKLKYSENITILPIGLSFKPLERVSEKESNPTLVFVGRLRKSKRIHHIIQALNIVKKRIPNIRLHIVGGHGKPRYIKKLNYLIRKYNLQDNIIFHGYVDEQTKRDLIKQSHAIVISSIREGWGMVVSEANALSTPAIGYNVHGLRDSIIDGQTGLLTRKNKPSSLAQTITDYFDNKEFSTLLSRKALESSRKFSWELSGKESLEAIKILF